MSEKALKASVQVVSHKVVPARSPNSDIYVAKAVFPEIQHYVVILLPHGGSDLEARDFALAQKKKRNAWRQCASVFWQVCTALAVAEQAVSFEVRYCFFNPLFD